MPFFMTSPPSYINSTSFGALSVKYYGEEDRWLQANEYFLGANIGGRRELLLKNPFDVSIGRKGNALLGGEELFLGSPAFRRRFVGAAYVLHQVPACRTQPEYFARRYEGYLLTKGRRVTIANSLKYVLKSLVLVCLSSMEAITFNVSVFIALLRKRPNAR